MRDDLWVAIDFETATREPASACALGLAVIDGLSVVETRSWLVQPPANEYEWFCTRVHGICADHTAQEPEFDEIWEQAQPYIAGRQLLAHNAPFDARVLAVLAQRFGLELGQAHFACTVAMSRRAFPHLSDHKLPTVSAACGVPLVHHDAASDALACARVAVACAERAGGASIREALDLLGVSTKSAA